MSRRVGITDHALIRYMERALDIDIETVRRKLGDHVNPAAQTGAAIWFDGAFTYVFADAKLVTLYEGAPAIHRKEH